MFLLDCIPIGLDSLEMEGPWFHDWTKVGKVLMFCKEEENFVVRMCTWGYFFNMFLSCTQELYLPWGV